MLTPPIHCTECYQAIPTKVLGAGGKTKDAELNFAAQARVIPAPDGKLAAVAVAVPLCADCTARIEGQLQRQQAASKLIVPGLSLVDKQRQRPS